jgi:hypothetical protein
VNQPNGERLSVSDAAKVLGITPEAIRQRIRRGTIEHEQTEDGRYYVTVHPSEAVGNTVHNTDLRDYVETLKRELEIRNEELRRKDHIIAALTERIPAIEAPASPETRGSPTEASEGSAKEVPPEEERPSWWRRWFSS